jgi:hypothetical protein
LILFREQKKKQKNCNLLRKMFENFLHSIGVANVAISVFIGLGLLAPIRAHVYANYSVSRDALNVITRTLMVSWAGYLLWHSSEECKLHYPVDGIPWLAAIARDTHVCLPYCGLAAYCIAQLAHYIAELEFILFRIPKSEWRKDDTVLVTHHCVTIFLITAYALLGHQILWTCTMATCLHDISDILVDSAKALRKTPYAYLSTPFFYAFVISWIALRIYYIPFVLLRGMLSDPTGPNLPLAYFGVAIIGMLQVAQIYWTYLIGLVIFRQFKSSGNLDDVRE